MNCSELPPPVPAEFTVLAKEEKRQVVSQLSFLPLHGRRAPQVRDLGMILRVMSHICPMQVLYKVHFTQSEVQDARLDIES